MRNTKNKALSMGVQNVSFLVFLHRSLRGNLWKQPSKSVKARVWTWLFSLLGFTGLRPVQEGVYVLQAQQNVTFNLYTLFSKGHNQLAVLKQLWPKCTNFPLKQNIELLMKSEAEQRVCVKHLWFGVIPFLLLHPVSNALSLYQLQKTSARRGWLSTANFLLSYQS